MPTGLRYVAPGQAASRGASAHVVAGYGTADEQWFSFVDRLEVRRDDGEPNERPGVLFVADATVSRSHCLFTYHEDGRCFVRDTSRNGLRVDGRRVVPNVDVELAPGQHVTLGQSCDLVVMFEPAAVIAMEAGGTLSIPCPVVATVLVGDIHEYTSLVRRAPSAELQQSVSRVFRILTDVVTKSGGTVKEFQGDALVAFWEGRVLGEQGVAGCRAAIQADARAQELARDRTVWRLDDFPLRIDWALASGPVLIDSFGHHQPAGLSMIGEAPVLAFRLEKFANEQTGRILACRATRDMACDRFRFRDLGPMMAKGFDRPDHVFALEGELAPAERSTTTATARER